MTENLPAVSILMAAYNAERYVAEAVESLLSQTFSNFEFVIVNDGSTDRTAEILQRLAIRDSRINLINQPNAGMLSALNEAATAARAPLLARMDADDISFPTRIEKQAGYLNLHPECVAVGSRILSIDPDGVPIAENYFLTDHEHIDAANLQGHCAIAHPTVMLRRSALDLFPPYRKNYAEDLDLWLRLGERGRLANLPEVLLKYRLHPASLSHSPSYVKPRMFAEILNEADRRRGITVTRSLAADDVWRPVAGQAPWAWCRSALAAGNYRSARTLARKAAAKSLDASGAATFALAMLGPVGRALLLRRRRQSPA